MLLSVRWEGGTLAAGTGPMLLSYGGREALLLLGLY